MAHNVETMAFAGQVPWHGIGTQVSSELTPMEMLKTAKLDWNVEKKPVYYEKDGKYVQANSQNILVRTDNNKVLGPAGPDYIPFHNFR